MVWFLYSTYPLFRLDKHHFSTAKRFLSHIYLLMGRTWGLVSCPKDTLHPLTCQSPVSQSSLGLNHQPWVGKTIQDLCELNYTCEEIKIKDVIFCYFCLIYSLLYYHAQYYLPNCLVLPVAGCIIMCSLLRQKPGHVKSYRLSLSTAEGSGKSNLHFNTGNSVSVSLVLELSED